MRMLPNLPLELGSAEPVFEMREHFLIWLQCHMIVSLPWSFNNIIILDFNFSKILTWLGGNQSNRISTLISTSFFFFLRKHSHHFPWCLNLQQLHYTLSGAHINLLGEVQNPLHPNNPKSQQAYCHQKSLVQINNESRLACIGTFYLKRLFEFLKATPLIQKAKGLQPFAFDD